MRLGPVEEAARDVVQLGQTRGRLHRQEDIALLGTTRWGQVSHGEIAHVEDHRVREQIVTAIRAQDTRVAKGTVGESRRRL